MLSSAEIVELCRYLAPAAEEQASRQAAIDRIQAVVASIWPEARLEVFGSFATGEVLPRLSAAQLEHARRLPAPRSFDGGSEGGAEGHD